MLEADEREEVMLEATAVSSFLSFAQIQDRYVLEIEQLMLTIILVSTCTTCSLSAQLYMAARRRNKGPETLMHGCLIGFLG